MLNREPYMHVFFRNIPAESRRSDLINVIEPVLKRVWFRRNAIIVQVKIIHLHDQDSNHSEFHGLVTIEPDAVAEKVIKRLDRKLFLGRHNDLRIKHNSHDPEILNRREGDRRRKNLNVVNNIEIANNFSGDKAFHREYK